MRDNVGPVQIDALCRIHLFRDFGGLGLIDDRQYIFSPMREISLESLQYPTGSAVFGCRAFHDLVERFALKNYSRFENN